MNFWDSSAVMPLIVRESDTDLRERQYRNDPWAIVWFGTPAEVESGLCRRVREQNIPEDVYARAFARFAEIAASWTEVSPTNDVRDRAIRLLRAHPLRAADAFQLAAALAFCRERTRGFGFFTADTRLRAAAHAEGFVVG